MHCVCVLMTTVTSVTFSCIPVFHYHCSILCVLFMIGLSYRNKLLTYLLLVFEHVM